MIHIFARSQEIIFLVRVVDNILYLNYSLKLTFVLVVSALFLLLSKNFQVYVMSAFELLATASQYIKKKTFTTDNLPFQFYYKWSFAIHLIFITLLSAKSYFGSPIKCAVKDNVVGHDIISEYCWITGTWTVRDKDPSDILENVHRRRV